MSTFGNRLVCYLLYAFVSLLSVWSPSSLENPGDSPLLSYVMSRIQYIWSSGLNQRYALTLKNRFSLIYCAPRIVNGQQRIQEVYEPVRSNFEVLWTFMCRNASNINACNACYKKYFSRLWSLYKKKQNNIHQSIRHDHKYLNFHH